MSEHNIISVSGGKDSTALLLLAIERQPDNMQAVFADTGNEHEITYEYVAYLNEHVFPIRTVVADFSRLMAGKVEYIAKHWEAKGVAKETCERAIAALKPTGNQFLDMCLWKGMFPSRTRAFCSEELKRNPIIRQVQDPILATGDDVISWQGVRRDESIRRANLAENEHKLTHKGGGELWNYRPILDWTAEDCFAMHKKHGIKHNPLYEMGMGRVGCMPCINCRKSELLEISKRFPEAIDRIEQWEAAVALSCKAQEASFFPDPDRQAGKEMRGVRNMVRWSQTGRGGHQMDWMKMMEDDGPTCTSIYGLCE
jgi:3'-phosphoadenosine 5'-phosphosulfate sulfotransferase (PAPS reductase)/FAD synthetase